MLASAAASACACLVARPRVTRGVGARPACSVVTSRTVPPPAAARLTAAAARLTAAATVRLASGNGNHYHYHNLLQPDGMPGPRTRRDAAHAYGQDPVRPAAEGRVGRRCRVGRRAG